MKTIILFIGFSFMLTSADSKDAVLKSKSPRKVTICHVPPGNPSNTHSITISENALEAHLAHGDFFGDCDGKSNGGGSTGGSGSTEGDF